MSHLCIVIFIYISKFSKIFHGASYGVVKLLIMQETKAVEVFPFQFLQQVVEYLQSFDNKTFSDKLRIKIEATPAINPKIIVKS